MNRRGGGRDGAASLAFTHADPARVYEKLTELRTATPLRPRNTR